ncbi:MAG: GNAT family N-acetyltransferase [Tateyamaria sp.]|uniref:GNAT family N-acetyltransferase n=1 Tax=Tateyamaria sp. TaxID=1929288 RepID=UPI00329C89FA
MAEITALAYPEDSARVLDLCQRTNDYVRLETGKDPDGNYVRENMTDAPPNVSPDHVWCWGHSAADKSLDAVATCLKGFYAPNEWYLGLLLVAKSARNTGLGKRMAQHVIDQARSDAATCLRIAVLDSNPRARNFWHRLNFAHEKSTTGGDGQLRHVHRLPL